MEQLSIQFAINNNNDIDDISRDRLSDARWIVYYN